jgi:F-type H+-transporting ATPase subunit b
MHLLLFAEEVVQLFPDGSLFIHIAMVLAMIWILNRTLYRPINRVLEARDRAKGGRSSEAEDILQKAEAEHARYSKETLAARSQGYELVEGEHKKNTAQREKKLAEAKAAVADEFATGRAELEKEVENARNTIRTEAEKMADTIAGNILKA